MVGNISNYTKIDILRCFLAIEKNISRNELVQKLDLGEGTIRTILDILKEKQYIRSTRQGHSLTKKGILARNRIYQSIILPKRLLVSIYPNYKKIGVVIKNIEKKRITIEKRDIAIKNGAEGCLIFNYSNNKLQLLIFPFKQNFDELKNHFHFNEGDILIVTFANSFKWAEISALAVVLELHKELKKIFNSFY